MANGKPKLKSLKISEDIHDRLRKFCAEKSTRKLGQIADAAIETYLDRQRKARR